jgi:hypothetical protein
VHQAHADRAWHSPAGQRRGSRCSSHDFWTTTASHDPVSLRQGLSGSRRRRFARNYDNFPDRLATLGPRWFVARQALRRSSAGEAFSRLAWWPSSAPDSKPPRVRQRRSMLVSGKVNLIILAFPRRQSSRIEYPRAKAIGRRCARVSTISPFRRAQPPGTQHDRLRFPASRPGQARLGM